MSFLVFKHPVEKQYLFKNQEMFRCQSISLSLLKDKVRLLTDLSEHNYEGNYAVDKKIFYIPVSDIEFLWSTQESRENKDVLYPENFLRIKTSKKTFEVHGIICGDAERLNNFVDELDARIAAMA